MLCLRTLNQVMKWQYTRQPRRRYYVASTWRGYSFCTNKDQVGKDQVGKEATEQAVPEKAVAPSLMREIMGTIKESTVSSAVATTKRVREGMVNFKKEANNWDENVGAVKTCFNLTKHAWKKTFPSGDEEVRVKMERAKKLMQEEKAKEAKELSEEDLAKIQEKIPEWKKTALQVQEGEDGKESLGSKLKEKIANRLNQTETMKQVKSSEEFKEYSTFKAEMKQFKEDVKERVQNHPSNVVQGSIYLYKVATNETDTSKAIRGMRLIDPDFDLFELEKQASVIFQGVYETFLRGELACLEKCCGEMALGYFKVLLKKREAEKCEPKHKRLWDLSEAQFVKALVPESTKLPAFCFSIRIQEIHCMMSKSDPTKVVDGDEERVMALSFSFTLCPSTKPVVEELGHAWEMVEIQPAEAIKLLV